ncbi:MAG: hypothetical protein HFE85_01205 [Clostridiales bacterium]|nr:hypothetical protein [Clostridiales bacterium]
MKNQDILEVCDLDYRTLAKAKLNGYLKLQTGLRNLEERVREIDALLVSMGPGTFENIRVQGGKGNAEESRRLSLLAEKEQLLSILRFKRSDVARVQRGLAALTPEERTILDRFYINRTDRYLENLMDELGYERRAIYYRHDEALRDFAVAMYGLVED